MHLTPVKRGTAKTPKISPAAEDGARHIKKSRGLLCQRVEVRNNFIRQQQKAHPITVLSRVMEISRSGYYKFMKDSHQKPVDKDLELLSQIRHIYQKSRGTYGSQRIVKSLQAAGYSLGQYKVRSLMKKAGLSAKYPQKFKITPDSRHELPVVPNLLNQQFQIDRPNKIWCGDITSIVA